MPVYLPTLASIAVAALCVLLSATLFAKFVPLKMGGPNTPSEQAIRVSAGVVVILLLIINLNLWIPGHWIYSVMIATGCVGAARLWVARHSGSGQVLTWIGWMLLLSLLAAVATAYRVDAAHHWLVETSNHDTLFYYEGAHWAAKNAVYVGPSFVENALGLGNCQQGAVYIGNNCPVYRGGSFSLLGYALGFGGGDGANDMLLASAIGTLLIGVGLLPLFAQYEPRSTKGRLGWAGLAAFLTLIIALSPTMLAAAINSNIATTFGTSAAAMVLAFSLHSDAVWWRRPLMTGLGAAVAAHTYGEAAAPAVVFSAASVLIAAIQNRSLLLFIKGGAIAAAAFLIGANVVAMELIESAKAVEAIATGGQWEGYYLNENPLSWIASPFAGMVINGAPYVSSQMLTIGTALTLLVSLCSLNDRRALGAAITLFCVSALLIGFVEYRQYVYGEHKVVQMIGTSACILAAGVVIRFLGSAQGIVSVRAKWLQRGLALLIMLLMLAAIRAQARPSLKVVEAWQPQHGLSLDFKRDLAVTDPVADWVIDDTAASGMERFQKTHYVAYIVSADGGRVHLSNLDADGMRGGYARQVLGGTFSSLKEANWLVQLKSHDQLSSPFIYPGIERKSSTEYDLVDLNHGLSAIATSGVNWSPCNAGGCPVSNGFEIETLSWANGSNSCEMSVSMSAANNGATRLRLSYGDDFQREVDLSGEELHIQIPAGWNRLRFDAESAMEGPAWNVQKVAVTCANNVVPSASVDFNIDKQNR